MFSNCMQLQRWFFKSHTTTKPLKFILLQPHQIVNYIELCFHISIRQNASCNKFLLQRKRARYQDSIFDVNLKIRRPSGTQKASVIERRTLVAEKRYGAHLKKCIILKIINQRCSRTGYSCYTTGASTPEESPAHAENNAGMHHHLLIQSGASPGARRGLSEIRQRRSAGLAKQEIHTERDGEIEKPVNSQQVITNPRISQDVLGNTVDVLSQMRTDAHSRL